jgi:hypothetical protein
VRRGVCVFYEGLPACDGGVAVGFGGGSIVPEGLAGDFVEGADGDEAFGGVVAVEHDDELWDGGAVVEFGGLDGGLDSAGGLEGVEVGLRVAGAGVEEGEAGGEGEESAGRGHLKMVTGSGTRGWKREKSGRGGGGDEGNG